MRKAAFILFFGLMTLLPELTQAQCAMCRRVAESNTESNSNKVGKNLNTGILYLLAIPYLLGAVGVAFWYKNRNKT
ncbi:MAG: hypothetical protein DWQ44_10570 [Bacteroidetes bacterium]|nr:MAG: hypothetical protein DWQ33_00880 [Bacteroidota bacterium]REK04924.1 MAG: hypothetical protein DWQ39_06840 [Bacteroidota bacterium]REK32873.1 MAG: hypothetical protein DWQ44_10570 [Bacteroidota bacterium]REK50938.1 MAG: hypothetical protein DWQ48_02275 [Bacteroidota bacterium]